MSDSTIVLNPDEGVVGDLILPVFVNIVLSYLLHMASTRLRMTMMLIFTVIRHDVLLHACYFGFVFSLRILSGYEISNILQSILIECRWCSFSQGWSELMCYSMPIILDFCFPSELFPIRFAFSLGNNSEYEISNIFYDWLNKFD